jgi:hypothetical protein
LWGGDWLQDKLHCSVLIRPCVLNLKPPVTISYIGDALIALAAETEPTTEQFRQDKSSLQDKGCYYCFYVLRGLEDVGLE